MSVLFLSIGILVIFGSIYVVVQSVLSAQMGADSYLGLQGGSNYTGLALIRRL